MKITREHVALNQDGYISVLVRTENIRLPQGTLIVGTEYGHNISIQVSSWFGRSKRTNKQTGMTQDGF